MGIARSAVAKVIADVVENARATAGAEPTAREREKNRNGHQTRLPTSKLVDIEPCAAVRPIGCREPIRAKCWGQCQRVCDYATLGSPTSVTKPTQNSHFASRQLGRITSQRSLISRLVALSKGTESQFCTGRPNKCPPGSFRDLLSRLTEA